MENVLLIKTISIVFVILFVVNCFTYAKADFFINPSFGNSFESIKIKDKKSLNVDENFVYDERFLETSIQEEWNETYGGQQHDFTRDVWQTSDDGYILTGSTYSFGSGGGDLWIIKTDSNGTEEWNKTFGGKELDVGNSIQQTSDGGYVVTGWTHSYGSGDYDFWLLKTDKYGNEEWNKTFGGEEGDMGQSVIQTPDDGYLIAGNTQSFGSPDIWLVKTNKYGVHEWNKVYGGDYLDEAYSITSTSDGSFVILGDKYVNHLTSHIWLIKITADGSEIWNKTIIGSHHETGKMIQQTLDNGFIIVGASAFANGTGLLIKTDAYGVEEWNHTYGKGAGHAICQAAYEGFIFLLWIYIDSYHGKFSIVRTDSYGNELWNITYGTGTEYHYCRTIEKTSDGGYVVCAEYDVYGDRLSDGWLLKFTAESLDINPPNPPTITGPHNGKIGTSYNYTISTTDPDGDDIAYYLILWSDNTSTNMTGPFSSGESLTVSHIWTKKDNYTILVRATDVFDKDSNWGKFEVSIPRTRVSMSYLFFNLVERFPILQQLLSRLGYKKY